SDSAVLSDSVLAARQPDSEPVWAKPTVMSSSPPPPPPPPLPPSVAQPVIERATAPTRATPARIFFMYRTSSFWGPAAMPGARVVVPLGATLASGRAVGQMLAFTIHFTASFRA